MTFTNIDLAETISHAHRFDLYALGQVFDAFYPQIYRYIAFRLGEEPQTAEMCAQVFDRLLEALKGHSKLVGDMQTWLFATAQTLVEGQLSQLAGEPTPQSALTADEVSQPSGEVAWLGRLARASLQRLVFEQQHLLALRFGCTFSLEETARLMGRNVSEVKSLQMEALLAVRRLMEEES